MTTGKRVPSPPVRRRPPAADAAERRLRVTLLRTTYRAGLYRVASEDLAETLLLRGLFATELAEAARSQAQ